MYLSTNYCCNNSFCTPYDNFSNNAFGGSYIWILVILSHFSGGGKGNCSFWNGYGNAYATSGFNSHNPNYFANNITGNNITGNNIFGDNSISNINFENLIGSN